MHFSFTGLEEAMIHGGLGHFEVVRREALVGRSRASLDRPLAAAIEGWEPLRERLEAVPGVRAVGASLHLVGLAQGPRGASASIVGVGLEPLRKRQMGFPTKLRRGEPLSEEPPAPGEDTVLLGTALAESLGADVGETITLVATDASGMLEALDARVRGIITSGVAELDTRYFEVHLATAFRLLHTDRVSNLLVVLEETNDLDSLRPALEAVLAEFQPDLVLVSWKDRAPFYEQVRNLYRGIFQFLGTIVLVLVGLAASNTFAMTVYERTRELATLRAIGTSRLQLATLLLLEAFWLGVLGAVLGSFLGTGTGWLLNCARLQMPPPPGAVDPIDLQLSWLPEAYLASFLLMGLLLPLAALPPVVRVLRLPIAEGLRQTN
jgi:putative ABC transport system permease protein